MQTHQSNIYPIDRFKEAFALDQGSRYFSYLPLSHIAERQIVEGSSLMTCGEVLFNENLGTLFRDLPAARPHVMFGPPRVWEQLQQAIIGKFGSRQAVDEALAADRDGVGKLVRQSLGLDEAMYLLTAAAPTPPALIEWYEHFGLMLMEGFGQTEAMGLTANERGARKIGSIGRPVGPVDVRISPEGELQIRADGLLAGLLQHAGEDRRDLCRWLDPYRRQNRPWRLPTAALGSGMGCLNPIFCVSCRHRKTGPRPASHVRPFIDRFHRLIRPLLTSAVPSRRLATPVARGRSTDLPG